MKTTLDCYACAINQALAVARLASDDEAHHLAVVREALAVLSNLDHARFPPQVIQRVFREARRLTGNDDPYRATKRALNARALALLPALERRVFEANDPLEMATRLAVAGNVIDFGIHGHRFDIEAELESVLTAEFAVWDYADFSQRISEARLVLYLADNCGEIVFDRLLLRQIARQSSARRIVVVRGAPILNDATLEDAEQAGIAELAEVVDNGSDAPATIFEELRPELRRLLSDADLVIAKGQGNYESLSESQLEPFFLFKAKCPVVARDLAVPLGSNLLARGGRQAASDGAAGDEVAAGRRDGVDVAGMQAR